MLSLILVIKSLQYLRESLADNDLDNAEFVYQYVPNIVLDDTNHTAMRFFVVYLKPHNWLCL